MQLFPKMTHYELTYICSYVCLSVTYPPSTRKQKTIQLLSSTMLLVNKDLHIYIFIHHNIIESSEQKEQQKSTQKRKKKATTMAQVTQIYI